MTPALLCSLLFAAAMPAAPTDDTIVSIEADRLMREPDGHVHAEGHVRLRAGTLQLHAERLAFDPATGLGLAEGGLALVAPPWAARADSVRLDVKSQRLTLQGAALFQKKGRFDEGALLAAPDVATLGAIGENALDLRSATIERAPDGSWRAADPAVTPCDCDDGVPLWSMHASEARVTPDDSLELDGPMLRVREVPAGWLPWLSLPLSPRKTGLLIPTLGWSGRRGASYEQPFFWAFDRSWDATFAAGGYGGAASDDTVFQGPRASAELRWAPRVGTEGRAYLAYARELGAREGDPDRVNAQLGLKDDWGGGLTDHVAISLVSHRSWLQDFTDDVTQRSAQGLRSTAHVAWRTEPALLTLGGAWLQDLRGAVQPLPDQPVPEELPEDPPQLFGEGARRTLQRVPALSFDLPGVALGPALLTVAGAAGRFAPEGLSGSSDEGRDGLGPGDRGWIGPDAGEGNGRFDPGEDRGVTRLSLRPTLRLDALRSRFATLEATAGARAAFYGYDEGGEGHTTWGFAALKAGSALERTFGGDAPTLRHRIGPELQLVRLWPGATKAAPVVPYDELDLAPERTSTQLSAALVQRLDLPGPAVPGLRLATGALRRLGDGAQSFPFLDAGATFAHSHVGLRAVTDEQGTPDELRLDGELGDERGDRLRFGWRRAATGGSTRLRAVPDALVAIEAPVEPLPAELHQASAGTTVVLVHGVSLRYDLLWLFTIDELLQQTAGVRWKSDCDCLTAELSAALRRGEETPDLFFGLDLGGLL